MVRNYFKIAWRNLIKNKAFSFINVFGLAIGIAVCFIIMLFVQDELSFDRYNTNADRIVRISFKANINGGNISESGVMPPVAQVLKKDYPEVEDAVRIRNEGTPKVTYGTSHFKEGQLATADPNIFNVFTFTFIKGDASTALSQPNTVVINTDMAKKYFGNEEPLGKALFFNGSNVPCKVTGVFTPLPLNAHFRFDMIATLVGDKEAGLSTWMSGSFHTYLLLRPGTDYHQLEAKLPSMVERYMGPEMLQAMQMSLAQFRTKGNKLGFALQPLTSIHLHGDTTNEFEAGGDIKYVYIFSAIALFMLIIASINFINLSTAGGSKRAKEVGIRKVMGSGRQELVRQFLLESLLITFLAVIIAGIIVQIALPFFNTLSGKQLESFLTPAKIFALLAIGILVGLLAGIYPAFFLSSFKPIATLKGKFSPRTGAISLRSGLVVFQFFISVSLIAGTIIVYQQMHFIRNTKLGYNKDQLLMIDNSWALGKNERVLREMLLKDTRVENVTISSYRPAGPTNKNNALAYPAGKQNQISTSIEYKVDERYIPTLGIQLAEGRNFSPEFPTDSTGIIINETAAKAFGWGNHAVGQTLIRENSDRGVNVPYTVIGVVKDFHFRSLHEAISPLLMVLNPEWGLIVKVKTANVSGLLTSIRAQWNAFNPEEPFSYSFMDDLYNKTYDAEQKTGWLLNIFAVLTILVACLGLFGLVTYTTEQRSKEIGIRKVLGANVGGITAMLSKEFLKLVLIGCMIAVPLSWWIMHQWLQDFAYKIEINWWVFLAATVAAMLIALITVSFKAIRAAFQSPITALRTE